MDTLNRIKILKMVSGSKLKTSKGRQAVYTTIQFRLGFVGILLIFSNNCLI
jgi:hypothetical protein